MATIDWTTPLHAAALRRLETEQVAWLTTVSSTGVPQASPVWFLWDDGTALLFSQPDTVKIRNLARGEGAGLHLNSDEHGGQVLVMEGRAAVADDPVREVLERYVVKYQRGLRSLGMSAEAFRADYSVPVRFVPTRVRVM